MSLANHRGPAGKPVDFPLQAEAFSPAFSAAASSALVNRTHRVVQQRALTLQARKRKLHSLWIPLAVSGVLLAVLVAALWTALEDYEASAGLADGSQMLVVLMWSVPLSAMLLAVVWFHRSRTENEGAR